MSTIKSQLEYTNETKNLIKQEIIKKGVAVSDADTFRAYPQKIKEIQQGYPPKQTGQLLVTWFDYDGTVLKAKWYNYGDSVPESDFPKDMPRHDGLVFSGWNYTPAEIGCASRYYDIAAMYDTVDGYARFVIRVNGEERAQVQFTFRGEGGEVLWGDGTPAERFQYSSENTSHLHEYQTGGEYHVKIRKNDTREIYISLGLLGASAGGSGNPGCSLEEANITGDFSFSNERYQPTSPSPRTVSFGNGFANKDITEAGGARFVGVPRSCSCVATYYMEYISLPPGATFATTTSTPTTRIKRVCADKFASSNWSPNTISCGEIQGTYNMGAPIDQAGEKTITIFGGGGLSDTIFYFRNVIIGSPTKVDISTRVHGAKVFRKIFVRDELVNQYNADPAISGAKIYAKPLSSFVAEEV